MAGKRANRNTRKSTREYLGKIDKEKALAQAERILGKPCPENFQDWEDFNSDPGGFDPFADLDEEDSLGWHYDVVGYENDGSPIYGYLPPEEEGLQYPSLRSIVR